MRYHDLNIYVLLEIFHQYAIITNDGPFGLILVCTLWRDLILSTPVLWSYITIDESSSDYQVKLDVVLALCGDLPVTFALVLPLSSLKSIKDHLLRASSLYIHLDNTIDSEPPLGALRDGDEAMEMMIRLLKEADIRYKGLVTWYYNQAPIYMSTKRMDDKVYSRQREDSKEPLDIYFHTSYPILHTLFSTRWGYRNIYETTNLFRHLKTMINLQALHLSCDALTDSYRTSFSTIVFPRLNELLLSDLSRDEVPSKVWTLLEELIQWISAPALEHVGITASVCSVLHMIHSIYKRHRPSLLTLNIGPEAGLYNGELVCDGLTSLRRIDIGLSPHIINEDRVWSQLEKVIFQHISPNAVCTFIIDYGPELPLNAFRGLRCPFNVTYKGSYPSKPFQNSFKHTVDTLTFQTSGTSLQKVRRPQCRKLCYAPNLCNIHLPGSWPANLKELDSSNNGFQNLDMRTIGSRFSHLITVTCTPWVALRPRAFTAR